MQRVHSVPAFFHAMPMLNYPACGAFNAWKVREMRELSEMQVISPILFWEVGPLQLAVVSPFVSWTGNDGRVARLCWCRLFWSLGKTPKQKPKVNLEVYTPTFTTIQFRNFLNKLSRSQQIEVASLGKALKMLWRTFSWRRRSWMQKTPHLAWAKLSDSEARCGLLTQGKNPTKKPKQNK